MCDRRMPKQETEKHGQRKIFRNSLQRQAEPGRQGIHVAFYSICHSVWQLKWQPAEIVSKSIACINFWHFDWLAGQHSSRMSVLLIEISHVKKKYIFASFFQPFLAASSVGHKKDVIRRSERLEWVWVWVWVWVWGSSLLHNWVY